MAARSVFAMSRVDDVLLAAESLEPDDRLRLIARLWASLPQGHWAAPSAAELAAVERRLANHAIGQTVDVPWEIVSRMLVNRETAPRSKIYSAPRRFDLATVFAVMTAYSLLFAVMSGFNFPATISALVGGFVTLVGIGQALLFRGEKPRRASMLVGCVCFTLPWLVGWLTNSRMMPREMLWLVLANGILSGAILGYFAGVLVGGVFLVADLIRRRFKPQADANETPAVTPSPITKHRW
jgi:putative addiction module component (TIGR02574 family)